MISIMIMFKPTTKPKLIIYVLKRALETWNECENVPNLLKEPLVGWLSRGEFERKDQSSNPDEEEKKGRKGKVALP